MLERMKEKRTTEKHEWVRSLFFYFRISVLLMVQFSSRKLFSIESFWNRYFWFSNAFLSFLNGLQGIKRATAATCLYIAIKFIEEQSTSKVLFFYFFLFFTLFLFLSSLFLFISFVILKIFQNFICHVLESLAKHYSVSRESILAEEVSFLSLSLFLSLLFSYSISQSLSLTFTLSHSLLTFTYSISLIWLFFI